MPITWRAKFEFGGAEALNQPRQNKRYSKELKQSAISDYLSGDYAMMEILSKYENSDITRAFVVR